MKKTALILSILAVSLAACSKAQTEVKDAAASSEASAVTASQALESSAATPTAASAATAASTPAVSGDSAQLALDWAGEYKGVLPCADCEGIKTKLKLNSDKTFELSQKYLGRKDEQKTTVKGSFSFDAKNPSIITLSAAANNQKFFIGENYVTLRAADTGEAITGPMADLYKLNKTK